MTNSINPSLDPQFNMSQTTHGSDSVAAEQINTASSEFPPRDELDSGHVVVQQFLSVSRWGKKEYQADLSHPTLLPPEEANERGPFEPAWQKEINRQFKNLIKESLIKKMMKGSAETSKSPPEDLKTLLHEKPSLRTIDGNTNQQSESPELSEPEIERKVNTILHAVVSGKISTLNENDQKNVTEATQNIQTKFNLPTWKYGTLDPKDLTPTKEIEPTIEVATARGEILLKNMDDLSNSIQKASDKMLQESPKEDMAVGDLVKIIAQAISELKQVLQHMQLAESKITSKLAVLKKEQNQENLEKAEEAYKKQQAILRKQKKQKKIAGIMKIVAPIVSGLVALVAVAFAILSLGTAAAPLAIAVAIVSTIMFAYTVVDTQEGYTQQMIEEFNNSMDTIEPKWGRELVKVVILAALVAALIAAIALSGGGAAASAGTLTASAVAKEVAVQMVLQTSMMLIMTTNILPDLVTDLCIATGWVSKDDQKKLMIIQMVMMAITLLFCMEAMAKGDGLITSGAKMVGEGAQTALNNTQAFIKNMSQTTMQGTKQAVQQSLAEFNIAMAAILKSLAESAQTAINNGAKATLGAAGQAAYDKLSLILKMIKEYLATNVKSFSEGVKASFNPKDMSELAHSFENIFRISGLGVEAGYSIYLGTLSLELAGLFKQLGDIEKEKEVLLALIQLLEKLATSMQGDQTSKAEWINNLTRAMDNMYASASMMSTKITQQYTA